MNLQGVCYTSFAMNNVGHVSIVVLGPGDLTTLIINQAKLAIYVYTCTLVPGLYKILTMKKIIWLAK